MQVFDGQDIYFIANKTYSIDFVYKLIQENGIDSINAALPQEITYDPTFKIKISPQLQGNSVTVKSPIQYFDALGGQNIFDLVLQSYFDLDQTYRFIQDNNLANINGGGFSGQTFNFNTNYIADFGLFTSFQRTGKKVSTGEFVPIEAPPVVTSFILRQDGGYLLRQDGGKFIRN